MQHKNSSNYIKLSPKIQFCKMKLPKGAAILIWGWEIKKYNQTFTEKSLLLEFIKKNRRNVSFCANAKQTSTSLRGDLPPPLPPRNLMATP